MMLRKIAPWEQNEAGKALFRPVHISEKLPAKFDRLRTPRAVESGDLCFEVWRVAYPDESVIVFLVMRHH
jgi:hypothetical protein